MAHKEVFTQYKCVRMVYAHILAEISIFAILNSSSNNKHDYSISHESLMYARTHKHTLRFDLNWMVLFWNFNNFTRTLQLFVQVQVEFFSSFAFTLRTNLGERKTSFNAYQWGYKEDCIEGLKQVIFFTFSCFQRQRQFGASIKPLFMVRRRFWPSINRSTISLFRWV